MTAVIFKGIAHNPVTMRVWGQGVQESTNKYDSQDSNKHAPHKVLICCEDKTVGTLDIWARGVKENYQFQYDPKWLVEGFGINPILPLTEHPLFLTELYGCFKDIGPDRWGWLIQRRNSCQWFFSPVFDITPTPIGFSKQHHAL
ncbi:HipA N-terminal domain-containing protein [Helicobacter heilmannii]|nr:HipA N-terminal domain-containing protein [Helicobacter heilmannii]BDQ27309.1 hypothetical protein ASB1_09850 [Helicobacter heilmannii]GMB94982.1 hypothetical protein NHP21011_10770 [Helicobacter heilmannii]CRF47837.1 hypothetical protein HHE02_11330 [Helicobacter heilmannii]CRF49010.1 hypothetical protein HHE03_06060 [Helicobacter heilmannii]